MQIARVLLYVTVLAAVMYGVLPDVDREYGTSVMLVVLVLGTVLALLGFAHDRGRDRLV